MRKIVLALLVLFGSAGASSVAGVTPAEALAAESRWNLLWITADDLNGDSLGWMGSKVGATPAIDAFAADCFQFRQMHVTAPICQPSRSAFMTGLVPHRNGALGFHAIRPGTPTAPALLRSAGYYTAVMNKHEHMKPDREFPWDARLGASGKNPELFGEQVAETLSIAMKAGKAFFVNANITDPHRPFPGGEVNVRKKAGGAQAGSRPSRVSPGETPVAAFAPEKVVVPGFLEDLPEVRREAAHYFAGVRRMDLSFAAVWKSLVESGEADRTIVVFHSDHGMSFPFSKATLYRNGTWTPLLLRLPPELRKQFAGPQVDQVSMVSSVDILPTLFELLGVESPADIDGRSLVPLMRGETQSDRDYVITHVNTTAGGASFAGRCVRYRDRSYIWYPWVDGTRKLRVEAMSGLSFRALAAAAANDERIAARVRQYQDGVSEAFYDLKNDPDERHNRLDDPAYRRSIDEARQQLVEHMRRTNDPLLAEFEQRMADRR